MRSVVVFPAPFGPRKPVTVPGSSVKESPSTAVETAEALGQRLGYDDGGHERTPYPGSHPPDRPASRTVGSGGASLWGLTATAASRARAPPLCRSHQPLDSRRMETISLARGVPAPDLLAEEELADCARTVLERDGQDAALLRRRRPATRRFAR